MLNEIIQKKRFVLPLVVGTDTRFVIHIIMLISYCCFVSGTNNYKALKGPDSSMFCRDTSLIRGGSNFFPVCFSASFKNQNIDLKKNRTVEAAQ